MRTIPEPARDALTFVRALALLDEGARLAHGPAQVFATNDPGALEGEHVMGVITTILVPTDLGAEPDRALAYACDLADALGASLHILHVVEDPFAASAFMEMYTPPPAGYVERMDRDAQARLDTLLTAERKARHRPVTVTRIGAPARQIVEYVRENPAIGLIVMATAGRGGVARLMMGSVADKVVRSAPCPVLTLHRDDHPQPASEHRAA